MSGAPVDTTVEERRAALRALEEQAAEHGSGFARAIEAFLRDDDWRVRKDAAVLAAQHLDGAGRDAAELASVLALGVLQGEDVGLRNAAIEALATAGTTPERQRAVHDALVALEVGAPHTALKFLCAAWVGGGSHALSRLSHHARDPDSTTATAALEAIARIGGRGAEDELTAVLFAEGDEVVRLAALEGLVALRSRLPAPRLVSLLERPLFTRPALRALGFTADRAAVEPLVGRLSIGRLATVSASALAQLSEVGELREIVASALTELPEPARSSLLEGASSEDEARARSALAVLLLSRDVRALPAVASFAAHHEPGRVLLEALERFGAAAVPGLVGAVPTLDPPAAAWSLEAAVELVEITGAPELVATLREALRDALSSSNEGLQVAALRGLARFGEGRDAAQLVALGARGSSHVAAAASDAIAALSTAAPGALSTALKDTALEGNDAPLAWSKAVRALPRAVALEKLAEAAGGEDPSARKAAIEALAFVGGDEAAELAAIALADEDEGVRLAAVRTLAEVAAASEGGRAISALRIALRSSEPPMRAAAVRAASDHGLSLEAEAVALASDPSPEVLAALFRAVALLRAVPGKRGLDPELGRRLVPRVELALAHEDDEVVKSALVALAALGAHSLPEALAHALSHHAWDVRLEAARLAGGELRESGPSSDALRRALASRRALEEDDLVRAAIDASLSGWGASRGDA